VIVSAITTRVGINEWKKITRLHGLFFHVFRKSQVIFFLWQLVPLLEPTHPLGWVEGEGFASPFTSPCEAGGEPGREAARQKTAKKKIETTTTDYIR